MAYYKTQYLCYNKPEALFLVMLGTSSFTARHKVYGKTTEKGSIKWYVHSNNADQNISKFCSDLTQKLSNMSQTFVEHISEVFELFHFLKKAGLPIIWEFCARV